MLVWMRACALAELVDQLPLGVVVSDVAVCLVRTGDGLFAVRDECTHEDVPLSEGDVEDDAIECWRHGSRFDLRTGEVLNPPAVKPVRVYPVRVADAQVQVDVGSISTPATTS